MIPVRTVHKASHDRRRTLEPRRGGCTCIRPRLWLDEAELRDFRELSRFFREDGDPYPIGQAISFLIRAGVDALLSRPGEKVPEQVGRYLRGREPRYEFRSRDRIRKTLRRLLKPN